LITFVYEETPVFLPKWSKIAENCDHNIDPTMLWILKIFSPKKWRKNWRFDSILSQVNEAFLCEKSFKQCHFHLGKVLHNLGKEMLEKGQVWLGYEGEVLFFKYIFLSIYFLKYTQWQCILSYDNSTAMYKFLKNLTPWVDSNPGSSVLQAGAMTTMYATPPGLEGVG
jgi:hypothetical protein